MSPSFGVLPTGFVAKSSEQIASEVDARLQAIIGSTSGTQSDKTIPPQSLAGQIKSFLVDAFSGLWDLAQAVATTSDPNQVTDSAQDALCSITGTVREPQQFSTVLATCIGTAGTPLQPGRVATVTTAGTRFDSDALATLLAVTTARATLTPYALGDLRTNAVNLYGVIVAGTSGGGAGPSSTSLDITDGSVHWLYLGAATVGAAVVRFNAEQPGPSSAVQGTLVTIATPVSGWTAIYNFVDATEGALIESNTALRYRRNQELAASGNATADAIRSAMLTLNQGSTDPLHKPIRQCTVFHNDTDVTDINGLPPHSVEILVLYGDGVTPSTTTDQDISNVVWATVAEGIATFGNQSGTVIDSQGNAQAVKWSKPTAKPVYMVITAYYDPSQWPATGAPALVVEAVKSAILTYAQSAYSVGVDVRVAPLSAAIFDGPSSVGVTTPGVADVPAPAGSPPAPGMLDASPFYIGLAPAPATSTPLSIGVREIATFAYANISVMAIAEAP